MNVAEIKNLLDKFYRGETSDSEEKILVRFFGESEVPEEFRPDQKLFAMLGKNRVKVPEDSARKIESLIDSFSCESDTKKTSKRPRIFYLATAIAASLALVFGIAQFRKNQSADKPQFADTYKNPDDAYRATMDALQLFSQNFSKGTESIEKANAQLEKAHEIIQKSTK